MTMPCRSSRAAALLAVAAAGLPAPALAALPPPYARMQEFVAVMQDAGNAAAKALSANGLVDRVERNEDGTYRFWAGRCYVPVSVERVPSGAKLGAPIAVRTTVGALSCQ